jgi:4-amino-4-deoxy-L-arabinose transferase-like glycosyltransferase
MVVKRHSHALELENLPLLVQTSRQERSGAWVLYGIALVMYLVIRLIVWKNTTILEDHDSVSYLESIKVFLTWDALQIWQLGPDTTPLYPFFGALFSLPGWSAEVGARLCSLVFSVGLAVAIIGIGQRFASAAAIGLGLFIMAINASFIPLSFSVLTEPIFIAMVYFGLWIFWRQYENPAKTRGLLLGALFGMSFLARTEGIIFLVAVPFLQAVHFVFFRRSHYAFKHLMVWTLCFMTAFAAIGLPQIWRVSEMMGRFAINGRQVWEVILNQPDGKSYEAKIYGLDYSPQQLNLEYIQSHPETLTRFESSISVVQFAKTVVRNFNDLYQRQLGLLIGPLGLIFFAFGILGLFAQRRYYEIFWFLLYRHDTHRSSRPRCGSAAHCRDWTVDDVN